MFSTLELQTIAAKSSAASGKFTVPEAIKAFGCRVVNSGVDGVFLAFGDVTFETPVTALGKSVAYIAPGESIILDKGPVAKFTAMTESGSAVLYLHAGKVT